MNQRSRSPEGRVQEEYGLSSPVREATNSVASEYMGRRWLKSRVTRWDYQVTRRTLLEELQPGPAERILEIGCGPGTWTKEVASRCQEVVAVDISEGMIAEAQKYTRGLPVGFVHSDFLAAPLEGRFDKIFSSRAIEYMPQRELLARKIAQRLAPGGSVTLITKTRFSLWRGRMRLLYLNQTLPARGDGGNGRCRGAKTTKAVRQYLSSPGQIARLFAPHGLAPVRVRPVVIRIPLFQQGFHEIPLIPEAWSAPFLALSDLMYEAGSRFHQKLAFLPLLLSESYCITLRHTGQDQSTAGPHQAHQV